MNVIIRPGFSERQRPQAAALYWQAFSGKLGRLLGPDARALRFLEQVLDPGFAIGAVDEADRLVGLAGYKTADGAMVGGSLGDVARIYGGFGALWRAGLLSLLERKLDQNVLLMDGICVDASVRGQGVGGALLEAIKAEAARRDCSSVRLDVIDTNPRAEALYRRQGFRPGDREHLGPLRHLFGFRSALRMDYAITQHDRDRRNAAN